MTGTGFKRASGGLVNTDKSAYEAAKKRKQLQDRQALASRKQNSLEARVRALEIQMKELMEHIYGTPTPNN